MGYDLHITKKVRWFNPGPDISGKEWIACVESDSELRLSKATEVKLSDGSIVRHENPFMAEWTGHPLGGIVWFDYRDQRIDVKNPDKETIGKMHRIAAKLGASVQGEKGEVYDP